MKGTFYNKGQLVRLVDLTTKTLCEFKCRKGTRIVPRMRQIDSAWQLLSTQEIPPGHVFKPGTLAEMQDHRAIVTYRADFDTRMTPSPVSPGKWTVVATAHSNPDLHPVGVDWADGVAAAEERKDNRGKFALEIFKTLLTDPNRQGENLSDLAVEYADQLLASLEDPMLKEKAPAVMFDPDTGDLPF